jgi:hypothetical protein
MSMVTVEPAAKTVRLAALGSLNFKVATSMPDSFKTIFPSTVASFVNVFAPTVTRDCGIIM